MCRTCGIPGILLGKLSCADVGVALPPLSRSANGGVPVGTQSGAQQPLPDSITLCSTAPMSKHDTEQLIGDLYHGLRSEAKKSKRKEADGIKRVCRAMYDKKPPTYSDIPPGWNGEEW